MLTALSLAAAACQPPAEPPPAPPVIEISSAPPTTAANAARREGERREVARHYRIDPEASQIAFVGAKSTGTHRGIFEVSEGSLTLGPKRRVERLSVEVDTTKLIIEPSKLALHLKSADFLEVARYPKASFEAVTVERVPENEGAYAVTGDLTLHGHTERVTFPATVVFAARAVSAVASFTIDRQRYGVSYPGLAHDLIRDEVALDITLRFVRRISW